MSDDTQKVLEAAVSLYTYAGNNYAAQWNLVSGIVLGYLTLLFSDFSGKLSKAGHYILLIGVSYYFYLSSTWVLQSIDLLNNTSNVIKFHTNNVLYDGMQTLTSWDVIWIHRILAVVVILVAISRIHKLGLSKFIDGLKKDVG